MMQTRQIYSRTIIASNNRFFSSKVDDEISLLEKLLSQAKTRSQSSEAGNDDKAGASSGHVGPKFTIGTFNAISPIGLEEFPSNKYEIKKLENDDSLEPHAILLRSHKLQNDQVPSSVRGIARCGAGTNNIPIQDMTSRGIPVFNTPGANANAVKELAMCSLLLASRGIVEGIEHTKTIFKEDGKDFAKVKKRVESDKKMFVGMELAGKTLGVVGLGHIGASIAETALAFNMKVIGYDPNLSVDAAWRLPGHEILKTDDLDELLAKSDYISLNVPYMDATHHIIGAEQLKLLKPNCHLVNFARAELVDGEAMRTLYNKGERTGRYICDFPDENLHDHPKVTLIPHLGASTEEAEENSASMAAKQVMNFIETGTIVNSVNFPTTVLPRAPTGGIRLCVVNKNVPGVLGLITSTIGAYGFNILQQLNASRDDIAYSVVDLSDMPSPEDIADLQEKIATLDGVVSSRVIEPSQQPGFFKLTAA